MTMTDPVAELEEQLPLMTKQAEPTQSDQECADQILIEYESVS